MKKALLVNPSFMKVYENTKMAKMTHYAPPLSLAVIGASILEEGCDVQVFDFNLAGNDFKRFKSILYEYEPDFVGITFVTALFSEMLKIVEVVASERRGIIKIGGGPHCSTFPYETINESTLDVVVVGEGDFIVKDIINGRHYSEIGGIAYRTTSNEIVVNDRLERISNLDTLPYPAYHLFDMSKYKVPRTLANKNPVAWMESSRGCLFNCIYCNKSIFGSKFRPKSPGRVVDEMERLTTMGMKEIHFTDDAFTTDIDRAKNIADLIVERGLKVSWALITGIRVNQTDAELFTKLKKAGCYRVFIGIESSDQQILNNIKKGITIQQVEQAVQWAKEAGIEVWGAFMIGLPGETEETINKTIDFSKKLKLDMAKMSILIPLPGTPIYQIWKQQNLIISNDWGKFSYYTCPSLLYNHPTLSWPKIMKGYEKFYSEFYLRPSFILKRILRSMKYFSILDDITVFLGTRWGYKK